MIILYIFLGIIFAFGFILTLLKRKHAGKYLNKELSNQYTIKDNEIYYAPMGNWFELGILKIEQADTATFTVLSSALARDKNHVYHNMLVIEDADADTVTPLLGYYYRDKNNVFYGEDKLQEFNHANDIDSIENDNNTSYIRIADNVYYYGKKIDIEFPIKFRYLQDDYSTDESNIYYKKSKVDGVNVKSYRFKKVSEVPSDLNISNWFLVDNAHVFSMGQIIEDADPETFHLINHGRSYYADKNHVFTMRSDFEIEEGLSPDTFVVIDEEFERDDKFLYSWLRKLPGSDPDSYKRINSYLCVDKNNLYWNGRIVLNLKVEQASSVNRKVFEPYYYDDISIKLYKQDEIHQIEPNYYTDGKDVFNSSNYIAGADVDSFKFIAGEFSRDANHIFYFLTKLENVDVESFEYIDGDFAKDKHSVFWQQYKLIDVKPEGFQPDAGGYGDVQDETTAFYKPGDGQLF